ncbi:hypothetical protein AT251_23410 [Enterovibrio nigricans]|nr:hypothetical protein [Enterovibrio nigricans]PKF48811.1 hypothetical protein AT251_23410 [Enterovibrio nigricans]
MTIADNADDGERVLIYDAHVENPDRALLCSVDVPAYGGVFASENSPIAIGRTVIISSTYGYPYPIDNVLPPSVPSFAPIEGGMHRIDLRNSYKPGKGAKKGNRENCHIQWSNAARSAAVPKLSVSDKLVYTVERLDDEYSFSAIEYSTGETLHSQTLGAGNLFNTLQLAGNVGFQRVFWQGTTGGIVKVSAD